MLLINTKKGMKKTCTHPSGNVRQELSKKPMENCYESRKLKQARQILPGVLTCCALRCLLLPHRNLAVSLIEVNQNLVKSYS